MHGRKMLEANVGARGLVCSAERGQSEFVFAFICSYSRLWSIFCSINGINTFFISHSTSRSCLNSRNVSNKSFTCSDVKNLLRRAVTPNKLLILSCVHSIIVSKPLWIFDHIEVELSTSIGRIFGNDTLFVDSHIARDDSQFTSVFVTL